MPAATVTYVSQRGPRIEPADRCYAFAGQGKRHRRPARERGLPLGWSFKRERALVELPKKIDALHAEMAGLQVRLADPGLYRRDPAAFKNGTARLSTAQAELDAAETGELELELLREEVEERRS